MTASWQYDEMVQIGKDFADPEVVEAYDARHRQFRDIEKENEAIIAGLGLRETDVVADFGSGTGAFSLQAARKCAKVYAVDISPAMLEYTKRKAQAQGLTNVVCCHAGFLSYVHSGPPLDAAPTSMALHHLPDFWKRQALQKLHGILKDGGRLFLADVVFSEKGCEQNIAAWIDSLTRMAGPEMAQDVSRHVREEHSTFAWIMEGLLARAGFRIDSEKYDGGVLARYFCTKVSP